MTELLERGAELAAMADAAARAVAGDGSLVLVEGPAGVGKTCLLEACAREASGRGMRALSARGDPVMMEAPFAAVRDLLLPLANAPCSPLEDGPARLAAPVFGDAPGDPREAERLASVMHGLYWLLAGATEQGPLLVCIDDADWLDAASARFVSYLAARIAQLPVLAVLARRDGTGGDERLEEIAARVLRPGALGERSTQALMRERLGERADDELVRACHQASGGNPFYLRELLDALASETDQPGVAAGLRGGAVETGAIARTVLVRLSRLGPDCELIARSASILAPRSPLRHAAMLAGLPRERAVAAADRLRAGGLLDASPELAFVHPIIRESVAAELAPSRLGELHGAAAKLLEREGASPESVAAHLMFAEPYGEPWVVETLRAAARRALGQGAPDVAAAYLRRALAEPPAAETRQSVLVELGEAEVRLPAAPEHAALREALERAREPVQRAELALQLALALFGAIRSDEGRAVLEAVLDGEPDLPAEVREALEQTLIGGGVVSLPGARAVLDRARPHLERAERGGVSDARMLTALAMAGAAAGLPVARVVTMARAALADERLLTEWLDDGYVSATVALTWSGLLAESAAAQDAGLERARRHGWSAMCMQLEALRAETALRAGDLRLAEEHGQSARALGAELGATEFASLALAAARLERGAAEEALALLAPEKPSGGEPTTWPGVMTLALRGRAHVAAGEVELGVGELLEAERLTAAAGLQLSVMVDWVGTASVALAGLGRSVDALELTERELERAREFGAPRRLGAALTASGRIAGGSKGLGQMRDAVTLLAASEARLEHARALVDLGAAARALGEREEAREHLALGLDLAHRCGASPIEERARQELVAAGARPRRAALSGVDALTPAESRTARMAASGLTNRAIAQLLFLSTKTVEKHLSQAYAKLGVAGRRDLPAALDAENGRVGESKE